MKLEVKRDYETPEHAGASGMYQILSVLDVSTGEDVTNKIDVGKLFHEDNPEQPLKYLKSIFGQSTTIVLYDPQDDPEWPFK